MELHNMPAELYRNDLCGLISDASKDAFGFRHRFDSSIYTTPQLSDMADYYANAAQKAADEESAAQDRAVISFEKMITNLITCGAGDRETAVRWIRDGQDDYDRMYGDEFIRYNFGLPYNYDLDHGDRNFFKRQAH